MFGLRGIAFALMVLCGSGVSLFRPYIGLLFLGVLYFFRPDLWGMEDYIMPVKWFTAAMAIGYVATRRNEEGLLRGSGWIILLLVLYLLSTIAAPMSNAASWDALILQGKVFVTVFLIDRLCTTPARIAGFVLSMIVGSLWFVKAAIVTWVQVNFSDTRFDAAIGQGGGSNYVAWVLAAMIPFVYYKAMRGRGWQRWCALGLVPLFLIAIMATGSRGGLLALMAGTGAFLLLMRQFRVIALGVVGIFLFVTLAPASYMERMSTITTDPGKMDASALSRYQNVQIGLKLIGDYPIFGTGLGTFPLAKRPYMPSDYAGGLIHVAHNTYIQMGSELGLPFLLVYLAITAVVLWRLLRRPPAGASRDDADHLEWVRVGTLGAMAATLVQAIKGDMAHMDLFWWFYGLGFAYHHVRQEVAQPIAASQRTARGRSARPRLAAAAAGGQ